MLHDLQLIRKNKLYSRLICLLINISIYSSGIGQSIDSIKSLPLKRIEFVNGMALCGYYNTKTKKIYDCDAKLIVATTAIFKVTDDVGCCNKYLTYGIPCCVTDLPSIVFTGAGDKLTSDHKVLLSTVASIFKIHTSCLIEVKGYYNSSKPITKRIAEARVKVVSKYLVESEGLSSERIKGVYSVSGNPNNIEFFAQEIDR